MEMGAKGTAAGKLTVRAVAYTTLLLAKPHGRSFEPELHRRRKGSAPPVSGEKTNHTPPAFGSTTPHHTAVQRIEEGLVDAEARSTHAFNFLDKCKVFTPDPMNEPVACCDTPPPCLDVRCMRT